MAVDHFAPVIIADQNKHRRYSCFIAWHARWNSFQIHCNYFTCSPGKEPIEKVGKGGGPIRFLVSAKAFLLVRRATRDMSHCLVRSQCCCQVNDFQSQAGVERNLQCFFSALLLTRKCCKVLLGVQGSSLGLSVLDKRSTKTNQKHFTSELFQLTY